jgi:voltage-gated potassium channel Kch
MSTADLGLVGLTTSKAVIVLAPETHADDADGRARVRHRSLEDAARDREGRARSGSLHIVAEIFDEQTEPVARLVAGDRAALILAAPLISRLLVQTGRQSDCRPCRTELLDFEGVEIYIEKEPKLVGKTFREAVLLYGSSTLIGVLTAEGEMHVPPPLDRAFADGDQVVAISEDDGTLVLDGGDDVDPKAIVARAISHIHTPERTLVLGTSPRLPSVLRELDGYVTAGSEAVVYGEHGATMLGDMKLDTLRNLRVAVADGDVTDRGVLESLDVTSFDHVLLLSETVNRTQETADARTTVTLLHLRDLERKTGKRVPITSEILDIQNRELATVAEADDFIVSNTLVSLMVSQIAENPHLVPVFDELFSAGGFELLKPVAASPSPRPRSERSAAALRATRSRSATSSRSSRRTRSGLA